MNAKTLDTNRLDTTTTLTRGIGLPGRVAVSFTMAGGLTLGGVVVALQTMGGQLSGHGLFMTATGLFVIGALLGLLHGATLGYLGRPDDMTPRETVRALGRAVLYAVPGAAVAWLLTVWIALTFMVAMQATAGAGILVGAAWLGTLAVLGWAAVQGWRGLQAAYARWPHPVMGTTLVAASFTALLVAFLADPPTLWLTPFRVTEVGAVLLAGALTLWVIGPAVTLALHFMAELPGRDATPVSPARLPVNLGVGVAVGLVAGLMAIPFTPAAVAPGAAGELVVWLAQALVDETLLRLFLVTAVAWMILHRWQGVRRDDAALVAVALVAVVEVLLYLPGVVAAGFPTALAAATFTTAVILMPAILFGFLYWKRGFSAALTAHVTATVALFLAL